MKLPHIQVHPPFSSPQDNILKATKRRKSSGTSGQATGFKRYTVYPCIPGILVHLAIPLQYAIYINLLQHKMVYHLNFKWPRCMRLLGRSMGSGVWISAGRHVNKAVSSWFMTRCESFTFSQGKGVKQSASLLLYLSTPCATSCAKQPPKATFDCLNIGHQIPELGKLWKASNFNLEETYQKLQLLGHTDSQTHTLDKNGSLYDPAGTESWNMQIRYETMKLTMHPTNNRSTSEWFPWPRSSSKMYRRRGFDEIIQIHRRNNPKNQ